MHFFFSRHAEVSGSFLIDNLSDEVFNIIRRKAEWQPVELNIDPEKGYDGLEWRFKDAKGRLYNVYSRWGQPRVGGWQTTTPKDVKNFEAWILSQV